MDIYSGMEIGVYAISGAVSLPVFVRFVTGLISKNSHVIESHRELETIIEIVKKRLDISDDIIVKGRFGRVSSRTAEVYGYSDNFFSMVFDSDRTVGAVRHEMLHVYRNHNKRDS